jgi:hypothetical protein
MVAVATVGAGAMAVAVVMPVAAVVMPVVEAVFAWVVAAAVVFALAAADTEAPVHVCRP